MLVSNNNAPKLLDAISFKICQLNNQKKMLKNYITNQAFFKCMTKSLQ